MSEASNGWFEKNWKWVVPIGCIGLGVLTFFGLIIGGAGFLVSTVNERTRGASYYKEAMEIATSHPAVIERLGEPVSDSFFVTGSVSETPPGGEAELATTLKGPNGKGKLYIVADKSAGEWTLERLSFDPKDGSGRIELLEE